MASFLAKTLMGGAAAAYGINAGIDNKAANLPARSTRRAALSYEEMASRGFWHKQGTLFGMATASYGLGGPIAYAGHGVTSAVDTFLSPVGGAATAIGAGLGLAGAGAFSAITRKAGFSFGSSGSKGSAVIGGAIALTSGAVLGGITARKTQLQVAESFNTVKKNLYKKPMFSNKARTQGPGYRLWTQRTSMGKPGHLGVTGSLPFAMHSARHRSTV